MIKYFCEQCAKPCSKQNLITLKGYIGLQGGITLPEEYQEKHFCRPSCFEEWVEVATGKVE